MPHRREILEQRTRYVPSDVEPRIFERWDEAGVFSPEPEGTAGGNYSIAVPPPNVTGVLHMGHALNNTIQDALVRMNRMKGRSTKWIFGTDHAGIATQVKVEEQLREQGTSREALGREEFIRRVWEWREVYGSRIVEQFKALGASCDYRDERFTMDDGYVRAVLHVFVKLFEKGLVYRDNYMVNWDPGIGSAVSDLEVVQREVEDTLYSVDYPLESGSGSITVATVRPETMLADTAIAVHPDDERYTRLIGETALLPLVGRKLPIIADAHVDPAFGTGALKITPGHDPADFEIGRRHGLDEITVIGEDGCMNDDAGVFAGMSTAEARREVVQALRAEDRVSGSKPYLHEVPHSHRSGRRIEPLVSLQWFCDMNQLAQPAIDAVREGRVRFHPPRPHTDVYLDWMENIRPWCVSRQLWWGHRIPVWYCDPCEETIVSETPPDRCGECGGELRRDPDVLDTWFSSALWPFATLGWPEQTAQLRAFYPTRDLVTGRDIIFLWVARMIMMGLEFTGELPFTDVPINSIIQAPDGRRMSKSLGTGIDPLDVMTGGPRPPVFAQGGEFPAYGADALRFGLLAMASDQDVRFSEERVKQGQELANKLWNASRLVLLRVDDVAAEPRAETLEDRWILSRLERAVERIGASYDSYEFSRAVLDLYEFFWSEVCDWYLELVKPRLYDAEGDRSALSATLLYVLERVLKLLHPVMPFVTEEIWSLLPGGRGLLAVAAWPERGPGQVDEEAERAVGRVIEQIKAARRYREQVGVPAGARVPAWVDAAGFEDMLPHIERLARLELTAGAPPASAVAVGELMRVGAVNGNDEAAGRRREQRRAELESEIARAEGKLANEKFVERAPPHVVGAERDKLARLREELERLG